MGNRVWGGRPRPVVNLGGALLLLALLIAPMLGGVVSAQDSDEATTGDIARAEFSRRNSESMLIRDNSNALAYSTGLTIRGRPGKVEDVDVYLYDLQHLNPADVDILLESPDGRAVIIMSEVGGKRIQNVNLIFDQQAARDIPEPKPGFSFQSGRYKPTNRDDGGRDSFGSPAANPSGTSLNDFNRIDPNGTWRLYIRDDDLNGYFGKLAGGWGLKIETTNQKPSAKTDRYKIKENKTLKVSAKKGVLSNDTDPDGDKLRVISIPDKPKKGSLRMKGNGAFTYEPKRNKSGRDTFKYKVRDEAGNTAIGKVAIKIRSSR